MLYVFLYFAAGLAVYFATQWLYRAQRLSLEVHRKSWVFVSSTAERWILAGIWPVFAATSLLWLSFELYDRKLKRDDALARQREAARRGSVDALPLMAKLDLLRIAAENLKQEPDKAPEPTPTSLKDRAATRATPDSGTAQL